MQGSSLATDPHGLDPRGLAGAIIDLFERFREASRPGHTKHRAGEHNER
jgi:hypothetical protein